MVVVCCWLFSVRVVRCSLFVVCCLWFVVCGLLCFFVVRCVLFVACCYLVVSCRVSLDVCGFELGVLRFVFGV